jgi:hypothetical protein
MNSKKTLQLHGLSPEAVYWLSSTDSIKKLKDWIELQSVNAPPVHIYAVTSLDGESIRSAISPAQIRKHWTGEKITKITRLS